MNGRLPRGVVKGHQSERHNGATRQQSGALSGGNAGNQPERIAISSQEGKARHAQTVFLQTPRPAIALVLDTTMILTHFCVVVVSFICHWRAIPLL
jgi:hypothetical protein